MNSKSSNRSNSRPDERPFGYLVSRELPHRDKERNNAAQHRFASPECRIMIEHGLIRLGQETDTRYKEPGHEL
ncbi:MAG: hypothetical protein HF976_00440 [ANME-2 cluster archaeon]|nr:hypothetical protein [ANME-2 cluster archaeon]MBC2706113.1 hypothetical protein [ANME-2 cluster archaeon]MBC2747202.1 hypothetical protein [ANME-2 cluster archaeon]